MERDLRWREDHADRWVLVHEGGGRRVRLGAVQKFGDRWFWAPDASFHWFGPAESEADARRRLVEAVASPEQPHHIGT